MEAYLEFCIFSMMNIRELQWIPNQTTISVNNFLCLFMIALVVLIPFVLFMIMWRNRKKWNDSLFGKQYGTYLGGMAKEGSKGQLVILIAVSVFFVRRAIMSFTIVFWKEFLLGQIAIQIMTSIGLIIMLQWWKPMGGSYPNNLETINEIAILLLLYTLLLFSDFIVEPQTRQSCGIVYIVFVCMFAIEHLSLMINGQGRNAYRQVKRYWILRKHKKSLEKKKKEAEMGQLDAGNTSKKFTNLHVVKYGADGQEIKLELKDLSILEEESNEDSDSEKDKDSNSGESATHRNLLAKSTMSEINNFDHVKETLQRREELLEFVAREIGKNLIINPAQDEHNLASEPQIDIKSSQELESSEYDSYYSESEDE